MKKFPIYKKMQCFKCGLAIEPKSNYLEMTTYNLEKIIERVYFHIVCWGEYNSQRVHEHLGKMFDMGARILNSEMK